MGSRMQQYGSIDADPDLAPTTDSVGGYEQFFGGTEVCPTCRGRGRISMGTQFRVTLSTVLCAHMS